MNAIGQKIYSQIGSGLLTAGEYLPASVELMRTYDCDEASLQAAIGDLIYEGLLERNPANRDEVRVLKHPLWVTIWGNHSLTKEALRRGIEPGTVILRFETVPCWQVVQARLKLDTEDDVIIMERLRTAGDQPISLEFSYYPAKLYPGMTVEMFTGGGEGQSSFQVMQEKFNLIPDHAEDEVTVAAIEGREAALLHIEPGTPVLIRFRLTLTKQGIPIKGSRAIYLFKAGYTLPI